MAQWPYRIVPTRLEMVVDPTDDEQAVVAAHFRYLLDLEARGDLILAGRTQEQTGTFGVAIFEAPDEDAARAMMASDLAGAGGIMAAALHPYAVAVARDGLA